MAEKAVHIAVIVSTLDEEYQSGILNGIRSYALANRVTLHHFVAFGNIGNDISHDIGEYNIFSLANLSRFDGVILLINTIQDATCLRRVLDRVHDAGIPAVCIDRDEPGFYSICIDNEAAMYAMTEHFIEHHGFRRINYISGPETNADSMQRLKAFKAALSDHNIPIEEGRIFRGHFTSKDGTLAVQQLLNSPLEFPEAIVCANDNMAVAAVNALIQHGVRVPEDVAVSGFDDTQNARNYAPALTTVARPLDRVGMLACQRIMDHLAGKSPEHKTILETSCRFSQSCGCDQALLMDAAEFKRRNYTVLESYAEDVSLTSRLSTALAECDSMEDYTAELRRFIPEFRCKAFYLCLCDSWKQGIMMDETEDNYLLHILSPDHYITDGYGTEIMVPIAYRDGSYPTIPEFPAEEMLPGIFDPECAPGIYYYMPLHFRERTMGYVVIQDSDFPMDSKLFHSCVMDLANSLESVRKIVCLDRATRKLNNLYTVDTLANINNRNGFRISTQHPFQHCIEQQKPVMLMFLDMDGLKDINDTYGHKDGDTAIATMAEVLRTVCSHGEICCRFGGDEFIVFGADYSEELAEELVKNIYETLDEYNRMLDLPYRLATSLGYHITIPQEGMNLFQLVTIADNAMYEQKKRKKTSRYLKSS